MVTVYLSSFSIFRIFFFFFQAEDGIRDWSVTGVQTCALPILNSAAIRLSAESSVSSPLAIALDSADNLIAAEFTNRLSFFYAKMAYAHAASKIGRASCRERV